MQTRYRCIVSTSWDDGHPLDLRLAGLLEKYDLPATFYVPLEKPGSEVVTREDILGLSQRYEIGSHTLTHPDLTSIPLDRAREEISKGKKELEQLLGSEVQMFAYPRGRFNRHIVRLVKEAGFLGARTTERFRIERPKDRLQMWTTVEAAPWSAIGNIKTMLLWRNWSALRRYVLDNKLTQSWKVLSTYNFNRAYLIGGIFHLWGHSWEIERLGLWRELEAVLDHISQREDVLYLTNGELIAKLIDGEGYLTFM